ncbi:MAG: YlmC/YmxH family sporulation protein [Ruminococcus sp.]|nr:YlmC/YmxH family sporulation protein [Ruminococcus sp.]
MICRLDDLRKKEVINILTGERLGYIDDVEMEVENSEVKSFIIYGRERFFGIFGRENDVVIPCNEIKVVGNDVVLIKHVEMSDITKTVSKNAETL